MRTLATLLGFTSGFALAGYHESAATMIVTSLAIDASLAPLTSVIAFRRGRAPALWAILGFAFGMWALAVILILRPAGSKVGRASAPEFPPPTSDAA